MLSLAGMISVFEIPRAAVVTSPHKLSTLPYCHIQMIYLGEVR